MQVFFSLPGLLGATGPVAQAARGTNTCPDKCFSALPWASSASDPEMFVCLATETLLNTGESLCTQDYLHQPCVTLRGDKSTSHRSGLAVGSGGFSFYQCEVK